jgi:hypothetical protein
MIDRLLRTLLGTPSVRSAGFGRALRGMRRNDRRELMLGLALTAYSILRDTRPRRELLFSKRLPTGSAVVIHHKRRGDPKIEVIKPDPRQTL